MTNDRQGGKKKPLRQPKKDIKVIDEDDLELKKKLKEENIKLKEMQKIAQGKKGFVKGGKSTAKPKK